MRRGRLRDTEAGRRRDVESARRRATMSANGLCRNGATVRGAGSPRRTNGRRPAGIAPPLAKHLRAICVALLLVCGAGLSAPATANRGGEVLLVASAAGSTTDTAQRAASDSNYAWHLPPGFPTPAVPADNPMSAEKVALGQRLFFEPRLSITGKYSCASCHEPARAYSDGRAQAIGATGLPLSHSAMSLVNAAYNISYGWTQPGRRPELQSLESQMLQPLLNEHPVELGLAGRQSSVSALLEADPAYRTAFTRAFPQDAAPINFGNLIKAIAAFERTLIFGNSPFDRYVFSGEHTALSAQAKRGMQLFYSPKAACGSCHSGFNFNGNWRDSHGDTGKPGFANTGLGDKLMRVPTLRNIALTAPYMHDGRFATLDAVLDHYARVAQLPTSDARLRSFNLSADERADLIAFLKTLTDATFSSSDSGGPDVDGPRGPGG
jgi:cytochrome c peroxidase